ncbi:pleckstrin homology domain-containing family A member 2 isoform X3 [Ascaphus truei]|uniref:pleckstrin homology domain-containing family A member 2 isoform X3 n=1 Tax=Ascaphus truei TaxID=8439 RepID=UPI003F59EE38
MPYVDRQNRTCGFLDIEDGESGRFLRRYFILDTQANYLLWYMDNPQVPRPGPAPQPETGPTAASEAILQAAYKTEIIGGVVVQTPINQNRGDSQEASRVEVPIHAALRRTQSQIPLPVTKTSLTRSVLKSGYCVKQGNVRKSWKRRYFILDALSIKYFKCEQDREPLRCIYLKDILKTHECLVKSGDLLMRDNLFEIITGPRTFYIQADSPQEMHSWIKAITAAIYALRMRYREISFGRTMSLNRTSASPRPHSEDKRPLGKSPSVKSSWQPWMPVPKCEGGMPEEDTSGGNGEGGEMEGRARHRSEPEHAREKQFPFSLDDTRIRTSNV